MTNALLEALPDQAREKLLLAATRVSLKKQAVLEKPNQRIENIYFAEEGLISIIAVNDGETQVEVGIVGREGVTGLAILLGVERSPYNVVVQIEGAGLKVAVSAIREILKTDEEARALFLRFVYLFMLQTSQTAIANARATIPQRLARWLLMAQDRIGSPDLPLTHGFLSVMMGVRRPGVTAAISSLSKRGVIKSRRGSIAILDGDRLREAAGRFYGITESEFGKLIGTEP